MRFDWLVRTCAHDPNGGLSHEHFLHIYERPIVGAAVCPLLPACKSTGTRLKTRTGLMGDDCTPGRGIRDMMQPEANKPEAVDRRSRPRACWPKDASYS